MPNGIPEPHPAPSTLTAGSRRSPPAMSGSRRRAGRRANARRDGSENWPPIAVRSPAGLVREYTMTESASSVETGMLAGTYSRRGDRSSSSPREWAARAFVFDRSNQPRASST